MALWLQVRWVARGHNLEAVLPSGPVSQPDAYVQAKFVQDTQHASGSVSSGEWKVLALSLAESAFMLQVG